MDLDSLSGEDFENLIAQLLTRMGFDAEVTKVTGDGGVDIVATLDQPITGGRFLIQCKRYARESPVGAAAVREFYGALIADRLASKGILITTSSFTAQAESFARGSPIELIGRNQLEKLLAKHGLHPDALAKLIERTRTGTAKEAESKRLRYDCDLLLLNLGYGPRCPSRNSIGGADPLRRDLTSQSGR